MVDRSGPEIGGTKKEPSSQVGMFVMATERLACFVETGRNASGESTLPETGD